MKTVLLVPFLAAALAAPGLAEDVQRSKDSAQGSTHGAVGLTEGEVRRVDKEAKKITLRHGPMPALDMPAHTMVFQVKDPAMLDQLKPGDKVRFQAEKIGGAFTITRIEPAD